MRLAGRNYLFSRRRAHRLHGLAAPQHLDPSPRRIPPNRRRADDGRARSSGQPAIRAGGALKPGPAIRFAALTCINRCGTYQPDGFTEPGSAGSPNPGARHTNCTAVPNRAASTANNARDRDGAPAIPASQPGG